MQDYQIKEIKGVTPAQFGSQKYECVLIDMEGAENKVGIFSKFPMEVGKVIHGELFMKGNYLNWKWPEKKPQNTFPTPTDSVTNSELKNAITLGVIPRLDTILARLDRLDVHFFPNEKANGYPRFSEKHDAAPLNEINIDSTPF